MNNLWVVALLALLSACTSQMPGSQMPVIQDSGPKGPVDVSHIRDAVPRHEVRTRAGNKSPYTVLGKTYRVLPSSQGYVAEGDASWYGNKFHGRKTANGEIYSMYGMTAAHKTLPIPSYVRVTNLNNGRQVVVRVNDRGPFHEGRVIDLTYAAASKLGFLKQGTAPVRVEVLGPGTGELKVSSVVTRPAVDDEIVDEAALGPKAPAPANAAGYQLPVNTFLQAGAFSSSLAAQSARRRIMDLTPLPVAIVEPRADHLYRVRIGPIVDNRVLMGVRALLQEHHLPSPHVVYD